MRVTIGIGFAVAAALFFVNADFSNLLIWTIEAQRAFQNQMATAVLAIRNDDPGAYFALLSAAGAYGFVHALGPGHGKYLIGGIGLGTQFPASRLVGLAVASSLAKAFWAIGSPPPHRKSHQVRTGYIPTNELRTRGAPYLFVCAPMNSHVGRWRRTYSMWQ